MKLLDRMEDVSLDSTHLFTFDTWSLISTYLFVISNPY